MLRSEAGEDIYATPPSNLLKGKWALITGASRGIGVEIAYAFARQGASLALTSRKADNLEEIAVSCKEKGAEEVEMYGVDLVSKDAVHELAKRVLDKHGIDVLVNNAGLFPMKGQTPLEGDTEEWEEALKVDLLVPMRLTRALVPAMKEKGAGTIINIGSAAATRPVPDQAAYASFKWGIRGWSYSIYEELVGTGVKVCLINPSMTNTDMARQRIESEGLVPEHMVDPRDVAEAALLPFRLSPQCVPQELTLMTKHPFSKQ